MNPLGMLHLLTSGRIDELADFLIDISSIDNRDLEKEEASAARVKILTDAWKARPEYWEHSLTLRKEAMVSTASELTLRPMDADLQRVLSEPERDPQELLRPGFLRQTAVLTARAHRNVYRNVPQLLGFAAQSIMLGVIIGSTYYQLPEASSHCPSTAKLTLKNRLQLVSKV